MQWHSRSPVYRFLTRNLKLHDRVCDEMSECALHFPIPTVPEQWGVEIDATCQTVSKSLQPTTQALIESVKVGRGLSTPQPTTVQGYNPDLCHKLNDINSTGIIQYLCCQVQFQWRSRQRWAMFSFTSETMSVTWVWILQWQSDITVLYIPADHANQTVTYILKETEVEISMNIQGSALSKITARAEN